MIVPAYLPYFMVTGTAGVTAAILFGVSGALRNANWAVSERAAAFRTVALTIIGWLVVTTAFALNDAYRSAADRIPTIQYGIFLPILIGGFWIWRSTRLARIIDAVPQHWLVGVQLYRALGMIFLILYGTGKLPGLFAWPAGLGDVLVGVLAPVVAISYARDPGKNADLVSVWNLIGLADLVIALATGFLTSPSAFQMFAFDAPNELITAFPLVLVPVFAVPVSVLLHLASLTKLAGREGARRHPCRTFYIWQQYGSDRTRSVSRDQARDSLIHQAQQHAPAVTDGKNQHAPPLSSVETHARSRHDSLYR